MNTPLLSIGTRVIHSGHGPGTIVAYNRGSRNAYAESNLGSPVVTAAVQAGLGQALVDSFYSGDRFPYVVKFDPTEKYPLGYQDVYSTDDVVAS